MFRNLCVMCVAYTPRYLPQQHKLCWVTPCP